VVLATRFAARILRSVANLLGLGGTQYDEDALLGIKKSAGAGAGAGKKSTAKVRPGDCLPTNARRLSLSLLLCFNERGETPDADSQILLAKS
jgi:hypothetical protein